VEFRILGPLEIVVRGEPVRLDRPLERKVLAALLIDVDHVVPIDRIIDAVWDDTAPDTAGKQIRNCVSRLRQRLSAAGVPDPLILTEPSGYLLRLGGALLDARTFQAAVDAARRLAAADRRAEAVAELRAALALWRGPALAGLGGWAIEAAAAALDEQRVTAHEECLEHELALGQGPELVAELSRLVAEHPLRERPRGQLMLALSRAGRRNDALEVYRQGRQVLVDELGLEPGSRLQELERAILLDDQRLAADPAPRPQVVPGQLPADVSAFAGRYTDLRLLDAQVPGEEPSGGVPVSVICGAAGVGKTALAVHWAHRVRTRFPDGQLHVNLRGYASRPVMEAAEALALFLGALGVPPDRMPVDVDEAAAMYRSLLAGRRVLVVLDHAAAAEQVRPLLPGSPGCQVVVTSRDRLDGLVARDGARVLRLDVLAEPEAYTLLAEILGPDRAAAEPQATRDLARLCAYLPLALRIAAAQLAGRPRRIASLVEELVAGNGLAVLAVPDDAQTAVRAAFDLSYATLQPETRRLFRLLGLTPGHDVTAPALAAFAGVTPAQAGRELDRLASAHLVDEAQEGRFSCHDLLRQYAAERARREDDESALRAGTGRLAQWYARQADAAAHLLYPEILRLPAHHAPEPVPAMPDAPAALAWLDAERANLIALLGLPADRCPRPVVWGLSDALRGYFHLRMHTVDWRTVARAGLAAAERDGALAAQAAARLSLGDLHWRISSYGEAVEHYTHAARLAAEAHWPRGRGAVLGNLGNVYQQSGRLDLAARNYRQALEIAEQTGSVTLRAANLENLGEVYWELGRLDDAATHARRALDFMSGGRFAEGVALTTLGEVCHALGRFGEAAEHLSRALTLHRTVGNRGGEAETLRVLALIARDEGRTAEALDLAGTALDLAREAGDRRYQADALNTVATVQAARGDEDEALANHRLALALAREVGNRYPEVEALTGLAAGYHRLGQPEEARRYADQALAVAREVGYGLLLERAAAVLTDVTAAV
jgi:DNA-binding SARP family transcriptional activator/Flp pilus assembly protein TadD